MIRLARSFLLLLLFMSPACSTGDQKPEAGPDQDDSVADVASLEIASREEVAAETAARTATLDLPQWPWWENGGLVIDEELLAEQAGEWCAATGGEGGTPAFFFGAMPLDVVGGLCDDGGPSPEVVLGHMYLSGWYGGLWFRDNADLGMGPPGEEGEGHPRAPVSEEEFMELADNAAALILLSAEGSALEVADRNLEGLLGPPGAGLMDQMKDSLLTLYGYNHGYVQAILDNPPAGVTGVDMTLPCPKYLHCALSDTALAPYAPFEEALARLADPPDETWATLAAEVTKSEGWAAVGGGLWSEGSITPEAWVVLVEINRVYLQVTAAAALGSLLGHGASDEEAGRCALLLEAATDTWNRAYFMALGADAPEGTMPGLTCSKRD